MPDERPIAPVGTRFGEGGRYEIREQIGRGGMAVVYKVVDTQLNNRLFAVKLLSLPEEPNPSDDRRRSLEKLRSLFLEESQALSRVRDNNVVAVITNGCMPDANKTPYMVMEYLTGVDLRVLLRREKRLSIERATDIILAVCAGVHACHVAGVIHRDLTPANIFLDQTLKGEEAKVLDFSVAKVPVSRDQTKTDFVIGTTDYMSPEQKKGRPANERSDQYSIGALLYFSLIGEPPMGLAKPRELRPDVPEGLEAALLRAMNLKPDLRFDSVHDLGKSLLPWATPVGRAKWKHYYTTPPLAMRPAFTGPLPPPKSPGSPELVPTRVEAYDFKAHDRTTLLGGELESLSRPTIVDDSLDDAESPTADFRPHRKAPPTLEMAPTTDVDPPRQDHSSSSAPLYVEKERPAVALTSSAERVPSSSSDASVSASLAAAAPPRRGRVIVAAAAAVVVLAGVGLAVTRIRSHEAAVVPATPPVWTRTIPSPSMGEPAEKPEVVVPVATKPSTPPLTPASTPVPPISARNAAAAAPQPVDHELVPEPSGAPAPKKHHRSKATTIQYGADGIPILH